MKRTIQCVNMQFDINGEKLNLRPFEARLLYVELGRIFGPRHARRTKKVEGASQQESGSEGQECMTGWTDSVIIK